MIRVAIADDHAIVRQGLRQLIASAPDLILAGEARNGWELIDLAKAGGLDLILTDLSMPGPSGVDLLKRLKSEVPRLPVIVLSMHAETEIAGRAIRMGAMGYLTKDSEPEDLLAAIRKVAAGGHYISPELAARLVFLPDDATGELPHRRLSEREYQVFLRLVEGQTIHDIAASLHLSANTVSTHKHRLMLKMQIASLGDLIRYAIRHGLIQDEPPA